MLGFPRLQEEEINPVATEFCGGANALNTCDSVLTYIQQLHLRNQVLTRDQHQQQARNFPEHLQIEYFQVNSAEPVGWDRNLHGDWHADFILCWLELQYLPPIDLQVSVQTGTTQLYATAHIRQIGGVSVTLTESSMHGTVITA